MNKKITTWGKHEQFGNMVNKLKPRIKKQQEWLAV